MNDSYTIEETDRLQILHSLQEKIMDIRSGLLDYDPLNYIHITDTLGSLVYDLDKSIKDELFTQYTQLKEASK